ncbi:hypothetical protein PIN31115_04409 [Pandoraea iniqua]|uniref:Uncharacterized protein n=1 Tax=Pandoraea iniqua TaxID=2508288 RepID=A0A5E4YCB0_9BURK|nr:hypothetical protein PIN31115_04409 [Pandoraea iniqua]
MCSRVRWRMYPTNLDALSHEVAAIQKYLWHCWRDNIDVPLDILYECAGVEVRVATPVIDHRTGAL